MKKKHISLFVVIAVLIFAIIIIMRSTPVTDEVIVKCIGENSVLYTQLGCSHCKTQEEMFGDNYQHLTVVDFFYDPDAFEGKNIRGTPTWEIKDELYSGIQSIEKLQELTGC